MSAEIGYRDTLITVAGDCPAGAGLVPARGVAAFQYALLAGQPYTLTQADVLFRTAHRESGADLDVLRCVHWDEFFSQPRACLRASPLPKQYGWGLHFDAEGRVALLGIESPEYREVQEAGVKLVPAMRSKRASGGI